MSLGGRLRFVARTAQVVRWRELGCQAFFCPLCQGRRIAVRLGKDEMLVRCTGCRASAVTMSLVAVLNGLVADLRAKSVYELSARGPLVAYLKDRAGTLACSELLDGIERGAFLDGVQCQDVQQLTYPDQSFDVCTSTEVFEHVPDDLRGFTEIRRVLKPGGVFVFTVPMVDADRTVDRVRVTPTGALDHLLPPEYHGDPQRQAPVLAFRNYGRDIASRLTSCGFDRAVFVSPATEIPWGYARPVVVAYR